MIASTVTKNSYKGDGVTKAFPFTFSYDSVDDIYAVIHIIATGAETEITSDFFIDEATKVFYYPGYAAGEEAPEADQPAVLTSEQKIIIYRKTPETQLVDLGDKYPLPIIEKIADKLNMIVQEQSEKLERAVTVNIGSEASSDELLKQISEGAATATKAATEAATSAAQVATDAAAAEAAAAAAEAAQEAAEEAAESASGGHVDEKISTHNSSSSAHADIRAAIEAASGGGGGTPIGTIIPFAGNDEYPDGYLLCNGASVSRTMYADLFEVIGTTYGSVDSTHFNLPDLTDKFIEGATTAGTSKSAGLPNITGQVASNTNISSLYSKPTETPCNGALYGATTLATSANVAGSANVSRAGADIAIDASKSNDIYGNSTTVQPPALTMRYLIKAFDGQTADSALIDVTQYANELDAVQTATTKKMDLTTDFTIIYPNGGTAENPATVAINSRYVCDNPFPENEIYCMAEVYYNNKWRNTNLVNYYANNGMYSMGVVANPAEDKIVVMTGLDYIIPKSGAGLNDFETTAWFAGPCPCRVKVWKVGKI